MGGLASAVGMSKSGLFAHFGSKEELQLATVARAWDVFEAEVLGGRRADGVDELIERWLSFFERRVLPGGCFFVVSAVEFAALDGPVRTSLADAVERQLAALEATVQRSRERGIVPVDRNARQTAFALHSILVNADSLFVVSGDRRVFDIARATIGDLLGERHGAVLARPA